MKKTVLLLAAIFCMIMLLAGCPKPGDTVLPTDVDTDSGYPVMGNPVVEYRPWYPTKIADYKKVDTGKTLKGQKIYRLYGTYIYQVGDTYYLDGKYEDITYGKKPDPFYLTLGNQKINGFVKPNFSIQYKKTLVNVTNEEKRGISDSYSAGYAGFVFEVSDGIQTSELITFDGDVFYLVAETKDEYVEFFSKDFILPTDYILPTYFNKIIKRGK